MDRAELLALLAAVNREIRARSPRGDVSALLELRWRVQARIDQGAAQAPRVQRRLELADQRDYLTMY